MMNWTKWVRCFLVLALSIAAKEQAWCQESPEPNDFDSLTQRLGALERQTRELEPRDAAGESSRTGDSHHPANFSADVPLAPNDSIMDRVSKLEDAWLKFGQLTEQATAPSSRNPTLKINGRIHLDHWSFTDDSDGIHFFENPATGIDPEDRFFFRRIRLKCDGDVFDNMLYRVQIDFNTPDSGEMKDMYIGYKDLPFFGKLLFGNEKRPLGLDHLNSSRFNIFIERPLVVEAFNEDARRLGVASYNVSEDEKYHWRYGAFALENLSRDGKIIGRIAGADWYEILGLESILNIGPLQVTGEYQFNWMQRDNTTVGTGPDLFFHGAYIYVA